MGSNKSTLMNSVCDFSWSSVSVSGSTVRSCVSVGRRAELLKVATPSRSSWWRSSCCNSSRPVSGSCIKNGTVEVT